VALGRRVQTPWTTPTNGGSHGAAPSRNLSFRCGQRPSVHRLQRCRGPSGPRASGATAALDVTSIQREQLDLILRRHGRVPRNTPNTVGEDDFTYRTGRRKASLQQTSFSECDAGTESQNTPHPERETIEQERCRGEIALVSTHTHRSHRPCESWAKPSLS
jgi:hypothetical protein